MATQQKESAPMKVPMMGIVGIAIAVIVVAALVYLFVLAPHGAQPGGSTTAQTTATSQSNATHTAQQVNNSNLFTSGSSGSAPPSPP